MSALTDQQAYEYIIKLLTAMSKAGGSDLFVAHDFPPSMKSHGEMQPMTTQKLVAIRWMACASVVLPALDVPFSTTRRPTPAPVTRAECPIWRWRASPVVWLGDYTDADLAE